MYKARTGIICEKVWYQFKNKKVVQNAELMAEFILRSVQNKGFLAPKEVNMESIVINMYKARTGIICEKVWYQFKNNKVVQNDRANSRDCSGIGSPQFA